MALFSTLIREHARNIARHRSDILRDLVRCVVTYMMQVPGSLVMTREFVDFVEVRAHVKQEEFIGISTHKVSKVSAGKGAQGNQITFI